MLLTAADWRRTIVIQPGENPDGGDPAVVLTTAEPPPTSESVLEHHDEAHLDLTGKLLE